MISMFERFRKEVEDMAILLIGGWYDFHKELEWKMGMVEFLNILFPGLEGNVGEKYAKREVYRSEYYKKNVNMEFHDLREFIRADENSESIKESLYQYVQMGYRHNCMNELKEKLMDLLENSDIHDSQLEIQLVEEFKNIEDKDYKRWRDCLFYYLYFAITDKLHEDIGYGKYLHLEKDIKEYEKQVLMGYGCSGIPGIARVFTLANRKNPNIIALYEMGEMEYYGRGPSGIVNYEMAYKYYKKTLELNDAHPLALWSIAYIKFNYKKRGSALEKVVIAELEEEYPEPIKGSERKACYWYEDIINKVDQAYSYGCAAAANLLGKIIQSSEAEFPYTYRGKYKKENAKKFFKESADNQYMFGCNNYAQVCMEEAQKCSDVAKKVTYVEEAIKYYVKSAEYGNAWALNKIGKYYLEGYKIESYNIVKKDEIEAYEYMKKASRFAGLQHYQWPIINLCKFFYCNKNSQYYRKLSDIDMLALLNSAKQALLDEQKDQEMEIVVLIKAIQSKNRTNS